MPRITTDTYSTLVPEASALSKGLAYLNEQNCVFYVTDINQLRVRAFEGKGIIALQDEVVGLSVVEDTNAEGKQVALVYFCKLDGSIWLLTYPYFGANFYTVERLLIQGQAVSLSACKHTLVYPTSMAKPDQITYFLMADTGTSHLLHIAIDPAFSQRYGTKNCFKNTLDPGLIVASPSIGFHPDSPLRMNVAVRRITRSTGAHEVGVYIVSFDDRDKR